MQPRRYELSDFEWSIIAPLLPNKPRGVARADDRRVLNGIYWRLRTGSPWADIPERYGPSTTCYNRFVRWRKLGVWDRIFDAVSAAYQGDLQMIDSTSIRVHQHGANAKKGGPEKGSATTSRHDAGTRCMGRSRRELTTKIHAVLDADGLPVLLADRAYDSDALRQSVVSRELHRHPGHNPWTPSPHRSAPTASPPQLSMLSEREPLQSESDGFELSGRRQILPESSNQSPIHASHGFRAVGAVY